MFIQATSLINPYNSIGICYPVVDAGQKKRKYWYSAYESELYNSDDDEDYCSSDDEGLIKFFNDKTVQEQLHVVPTLWTPCSDPVGNAYKTDTSSIHLFKAFKEAGLKVLLYSGNVDAQVSYL